MRTGCFQPGDSEALYRSVREKLFILPDETLVFPARDQEDRYVSSVSQEKKRNPRLGLDKILEEFREIMANLNLPYPKLIDHAVSGNRQGSLCLPDLQGNLAGYCQQMTESPQG